MYRQPRLLALVFVGGTVGTAAREGLSLAFPTGRGVPYPILAINVVGAFALGFLLDAITRRGPDLGRRRAARLLLGAGVLGGFTTYSALAVATAELIDDGAVASGIGYAAATLLGGAVATWLGIAAGSATHRPGRERR
ncbi:CrcB family protein [Skermania piniformis]|uniref:Fluoride-specific ion channel FluC n=1 Tax=Skermania pinensis TaxID=39122 RepID=A0ABX8SFU0_9ACTN|nr:CrcB family protein [Skermania piniformis]